MYNRYVPGHDGTYHRKTVIEPDPVLCDKNNERIQSPEACTSARNQQQLPCRNASESFDLGDLLLVCIVLLLLLDCDEEDGLSLIVMAAAFLLLQ